MLQTYLNKRNKGTEKEMETAEKEPPLCERVYVRSLLMRGPPSRRQAC